MSMPARQMREGDERPVGRLRLVRTLQELPVVSYRTCVHCGERAPFLRDGDQSWYVCSACGRYA